MTKIDPVLQQRLMRRLTADPPSEEETRTLITRYKEAWPTIALWLDQLRQRSSVIPHEYQPGDRIEYMIDKRPKFARWVPGTVIRVTPRRIYIKTDRYPLPRGVYARYLRKEQPRGVEDQTTKVTATDSARRFIETVNNKQDRYRPLPEPDGRAD